MPFSLAGREFNVSISQPPGEGRGKPGVKPGGGSGTAGPGSSARKPPSGNGRNGGQPGQRSAGAGQKQAGSAQRTAAGRQAPSAGNRNAAQRSPSQKTAGNRQVTAKTATQRPGGAPVIVPSQVRLAPAPRRVVAVQAGRRRNCRVAAHLRRCSGWARSSSSWWWCSCSSSWARPKRGLRRDFWARASPYPRPSWLR